MSRILVVEDESAIAELISINLRHAGFEVTLAGSATAAQYEVDRVLPDLVVLDWMLPGQSGVALARQWRGAARTKELPVIMLTARAEEGDKIAGLDAGADDYITKPFDPRELIARVKNLLRRVAEGRAARIVPEQVVHFGGCSLDVSARRFFAADGAEIALTKAEFDLLKAFAAAPGIVLSRDRLMQATTHRDLTAEDRTIDVLVGRLRRKLAALPARPATITTVHGEGYLFTPERT